MDYDVFSEVIHDRTIFYVVHVRNGVTLTSPISTRDVSATPFLNVRFHSYSFRSYSDRREHVSPLSSMAYLIKD